MDWFLHDRDLRHERVNVTESCFPTEVQVTNNQMPSIDLVGVPEILLLTDGNTLTGHYLVIKFLSRFLKTGVTFACFIIEGKLFFFKIK